MFLSQKNINTNQIVKYTVHATPNNEANLKVLIFLGIDIGNNKNREYTVAQNSSPLHCPSPNNIGVFFLPSMVSKTLGINVFKYTIKVTTKPNSVIKFVIPVNTSIFLPYQYLAKSSYLSLPIVSAQLIRSIPQK